MSSKLAETSGTMWRALTATVIVIAAAPCGAVESDVHKLEELVVTATRTATEISNVPADVTVIGTSGLFQPGNKNFRQALTRVPGIRVNERNEDAVFSGIEVRGLNTNSTSGGNLLVLLDGIPQRRLSFAGPYMGGLPYEALSRMELVKGPLSSLYGRGSLGGALQLFTNPGSEDFLVNYDLSYEEETSWRRAYATVSGPFKLVDQSTFSLSLGATAADGWQDRTESEKHTGYYHMELPVSAADNLSIVAGVFDGFEEVPAPLLIDKNGQRLPGIDYDTNLAVPDLNSVEMLEFRLGAIWQHDFSSTFRTKLTTAYWDADTSWKVGRPSDAPASGTLVNRDASIRDWQERSGYAELMLQQGYATGEIEGVVSLGGSAEYFTWDNWYQTISTGVPGFSGIPIDYITQIEPDPSSWIYADPQTKDTWENDYGCFLKNQTSIHEIVDVHLGVRWDTYRRKQRNNVNGNESTVSEDAASPAAGIVWHVLRGGSPLLDAYANWGMGFNPVYRSVRGAEIVELDPERSESYEVGLRVRAMEDRLRGNVALYTLDRDDVVGWNPDTLMQENVGDWKVDGVELGLAVGPVQPLTLYSTFTHRNPTIKEDVGYPENNGNDMPFVAEQMWALGADCTFGKKFSAGIENRWVGDSYADEANTIHLPHYSVLNARISVNVTKNMKLCLFGRNLLDEEYYSAVFNGIRNGSAFAGTPRTVGVALSGTF